MGKKILYVIFIILSFLGSITGCFVLLFPLAIMIVRDISKGEQAQ